MKSTLSAALLALLCGFSVFNVSAAEAGKSQYSPAVNAPVPRNVYWGDTHVHSALSVDAAVLGEGLRGQDVAYRFARGEEVTASNGLPAKLTRPLDFIVISDHAEYLGLMKQIQQSDPRLVESETGRRWHDKIREGGEAVHEVLFEILWGLTEPDKIGSTELRQSVWQTVTERADRYNDPGQFTAFIGYEWTSNTRTGDNLHRNVVFRDDASVAGQMLPFSAQDSLDPEDLWQHLGKYERQTGGKVLAIPHNGNLSNGLMFADQTFSGKPLSKSYAKQRMRWEPIVEMTQIKGDGEAHPSLSPDDEFADYENWDTGNLSSTPKPDGAYQYEYARSALKLGLGHEARLGVNPFQFGMIGSTDSHTSLATATEDNFWGKFSKYEPGTERHFIPVLPQQEGQTEENFLKGWQSVASGMAAVWAADNTREALFDAMQRREVYATTGPRITLRFFGGWRFQPDDIHTPDLAALGYKNGVPMGGELEQQGKSAPRFMLSATKDPEGANLDRLQVIKGWQDKNGKLHERIYDVALSDGRKAGADGRNRERLPSTVDVENATYDNRYGAPILSAWWQDPEFDPAQEAFYYVRAIEIEKPRWTAYDAKFYQVEMPDSVDKVTQDRAYSSPIWYRPGK